MASNNAGAGHSQSGSEPHWLRSFNNTEASSDAGNDQQPESGPLEDDAAPPSDDHEGRDIHQDTTGSQIEPEDGSIDPDGGHDNQWEEESNESDAGQQGQVEEEDHWRWSFDPDGRPKPGTAANDGAQMIDNNALRPAYDFLGGMEERLVEGMGEVLAEAPGQYLNVGRPTNAGMREYELNATGMNEDDWAEADAGADLNEDYFDDAVEEDVEEEVEEEAEEAVEDNVEEEVEKEVEEDVEDDRQATGEVERLGPRERCPGLRRSDPHAHLPQDDPIPPQARSIGEGDDAGRNLLAVFGNDDDPRTRYRLQIERARGRGNSAAFHNYPESKTILPARLTLDEICAQYPNHAWGSALRMFEAEGWDGRRIWEALPRDARHESARERPWNYIQRIFTRERENVFFERTGTRWQDHRGPQQPRRRPAAPSTAAPPPQPPAPAPLPVPRNQIERLEQFAGFERQRALQVVQQLYEVMGTPHPQQDARIFLTMQHNLFLGQINQMLGVPQPGQESSFEIIVDALQTIWCQQNRWVAPENFAQWQQRGREAGLHMYLTHLQRWIQRAEQELIQARGGNGQAGGQP
ncbi:hypothetical protein EDD37DRAFT_607770 [Exophiala viscosa]|uniref:uncharacterized protein n=1 Tax=Exophiala viscosa TaxID=2486360 RepID=UPI00219E143C|nr:hypothetical protein EDD37DRAFT_607770 [Exophiala viscosa]